MPCNEFPDGVLANTRRDETNDCPSKTVTWPPCRLSHTDLFLITWGCGKLFHHASSFSEHIASVTQPWRCFSKATPAERTSRSWVIITSAFSPRFVSCWFYTLGLPSSLPWRPWVLGGSWCSPVSLVLSATPPTPGATTALLLFLLFLKSALLSLLLLFLGSFKLWREFFSCDYSSFFQFWLVWRLCDYSSLELPRLEKETLLTLSCLYF